MKEPSSGIDVANIEEVLDAEDSAAWATHAGQNQYFTPDWLVKRCIEIDDRLEGVPGVHLIKGNCMNVWEQMDVLFPNLRFACINANPPFGKRWEKADGTAIDSTQAAWDFVTKRQS